MSFIKLRLREFNVKLVYYGRGSAASHKPREIYEKTNPNASYCKLIRWPPNTRTLFFDFLPSTWERFAGSRPGSISTRCPGRCFYDASRKLILKGVDGVIFVADSQEARMDANIESIENLQRNLQEHGFDLTIIPYILQLQQTGPCPPPFPSKR